MWVAVSGMVRQRGGTRCGERPTVTAQRGTCAMARAIGRSLAALDDDRPARPTPPRPSDTAPPDAPAPARRSAPRSPRSRRQRGSTGRTIRPGTPMTSEPGGTRIPSGITAPAATTLPVADPDAVEQDAAHADQALVLDGAAMQDHPVPHADPPADDARHVVVHVHDGAVLQIGLGADHDGRHVAAQHRAVPDARVLAERHVAHHGGAGGDEGGWDGCRALTWAARAGTASGSRLRPAPRP